jgi:hypothetical protein
MEICRAPTMAQTVPARAANVGADAVVVAVEAVAGVPRSISNREKPDPMTPLPVKHMPTHQTPMAAGASRVAIETIALRPPQSAATIRHKVTTIQTTAPTTAKQVVLRMVRPMVARAAGSVAVAAAEVVAA